jgi:glycosyltransferase involved in cell wall biosynthesis
MTVTAWHIYRVAIEENGDIYHIHDPELLLIAIVLRLRGKRVVYDVHEDLPRQIDGKPWIPRGLRKPVALVAEVCERITAACCSGVVAATPTIARRFRGSTTVIVRNFPMLDEWAVVGCPAYDKRPVRVVYVGAITELRGGIEMVKAMERLPQSLGAELWLAGLFSSPMFEECLAGLAGWQSVRSLGWQNRKAVDDLLANGRVGLALLHPRQSYWESLPIKLFEYMASALPVIVSDFPQWREIVRDADCGLVVNPLDVNAIAGAIEWLLTHPLEASAMGQRGREAVLSKYRWETEAEKLLDLYSKLLSVA